MDQHDQRCSICNVETDGRVRCGAIACQACKSFFLRTSKARPDLLICHRGTNDCNLEPCNQFNGKDGRQIRQICPKCRFQRCLAVKMTTGKHSHHSGYLIGDSPKGLQIREDLLDEMNTEFEGMMLRTANLPGRTRVIVNLADLPKCYLENFEILADMTSRFARTFNGLQMVGLDNISFKIVARVSLLCFSMVNDSMAMGFNKHNFALVPLAYQGSPIENEPMLMAAEQTRLSQALQTQHFTDQELLFLGMLLIYWHEGNSKATFSYLLTFL